MSKDRELELTLYLVANGIPFNPPLPPAGLAKMKENFPDGYAKLMEFLALKEEQDNEK